MKRYFVVGVLALAVTASLACRDSVPTPTQTLAPELTAAPTATLALTPMASPVPTIAQPPTPAPELTAAPTATPASTPMASPTSQLHCSNANSAAPSDSCSHIGARAHPGRRAYKLDPVRLFRARVRICGSPRGLPGPRRRNHQNRGQCAPGHVSARTDRLSIRESRRSGREWCGVSPRHSIRTVHG